MSLLRWIVALLPALLCGIACGIQAANTLKGEFHEVHEDWRRNRDSYDEEPPKAPSKSAYWSMALVPGILSGILALIASFGVVSAVISASLLGAAGLVFIILSAMIYTKTQNRMMCWLSTSLFAALVISFAYIGEKRPNGWLWIFYGIIVACLLNLLVWLVGFIRANSVKKAKELDEEEERPRTRRREDDRVERRRPRNYEYEEPRRRPRDEPRRRETDRDLFDDDEWDYDD